MADDSNQTGLKILQDHLVTVKWSSGWPVPYRRRRQPDAVNLRTMLTMDVVVNPLMTAPLSLWISASLSDAITAPYAAVGPLKVKTPKMLKTLKMSKTSKTSKTSSKWWLRWFWWNDPRRRPCANVNHAKSVITTSGRKKRLIERMICALPVWCTAVKQGTWAIQKMIW